MKKTRKKKHKRSILQPKDGTCYLCMKLHDDHRQKLTEEHHIFYGIANRRISEAEGFKVYLCRSHHRYSTACDPEAIHDNPKSRKTDIFLKKVAQLEYEKTHSRAEFLSLFGRNYLL